jgi:acyl-homoserine-lactone acylase
VTVDEPFEAGEAKMRESKRVSGTITGQHRAVRWWLLPLAACLIAGSIGVSTAADVQIRTTEYGVPHVLAADLYGAGFGFGYAFARTDICEIAGRWITVRGERSRYFGPDEQDPHTAPNALASNAFDGRRRWSNLESDFFWRGLIDRDVVGESLKKTAPLGPSQGVRDLVKGYVAGYNKYLTDVGVDNIPDPRCRGQAWVTPIKEQDVYLRALHWNIFLSSGGLIGDYAKAAPPTDAPKPITTQVAAQNAAQSLLPEDIAPASNMIALGREATDTGRGMMFANPHWRWNGPERWFEVQLTVPRVMNVYGAALLGVPLVLFGTTEGMAWSHTLATPRRFTVYELKLVEGAPTRYVYEGEVRDLRPQIVKVMARTQDGKLEERSHTFWHSHHGMLLESSNMPWTSKNAYAVRDIAVSFTWLNQQLEMNQANSVAELEEVGRRNMSIGWLNIAAADKQGNAYFADRTAVPHVTNAQLELCVTSEIGSKLLKDRRHVLDGSRAACEWGADPDSVSQGAFGPSALPHLERLDYTTNANDSYWLSNLKTPLEGFPSIIGAERTPQTLRTRNGLNKIHGRLEGRDGHAGKVFTRALLESITMDNKVYSAMLWRDDLVPVCRRASELANAREACDVLAAWDLSENLDSPGAVLWRRFFERLPETARDELFLVPFDPARPLETPSGLKIDDARLVTALAQAVDDLKSSDIPIAGTYRNYQYDVRDGERIPIHGGWSPSGQYNFIHNRGGWVAGKGWPEISNGSSYIYWVAFNARGPVGTSIMTYSQSSNPASPYFKDQVRLFSEKKSKPMRFFEEDILSDPKLTILRLSSKN